MMVPMLSLVEAIAVAVAFAAFFPVEVVGDLFLTATILP